MTTPEFEDVLGLLLVRMRRSRDQVELEPVELFGHDAEHKLRQAPPAILLLEGRWVAVHRSRGDRLTIFDSTAASQRRTSRDLWRTLSRPLVDQHREAIDRMLEGCGIPERRRHLAFDALLRERTATAVLGTVYLVRTSPGASFLLQLRETGLAGRAAALAGCYGLAYLLWIGAWLVLGRDALSGRMSDGWMLAWALLIVTMIPFRLLSTWWQGSIAVAVGGLLRQRLLAGVMKLKPEEIRHEGAGAFLGRAIESESVEALAIGGGIASGLAVFELLVAGVILGTGAAGWLGAALLALWLGLTAVLAVRYWRARRAWTDSRLAMSHDLIEQMTGQRTRVAQLPSRHWHTHEDGAVESYLSLSRRMDRHAAILTSIAPRGWLAAGIAGLIPAFLSPALTPPAELAASLAGVVLAWQALQRLSTGLAQLAGAAISWGNVALMFRAAARPVSAKATPPASGALVLDARDVAYRYEGRMEPVLRRATLRVERGDWILLEGESGGGKSTFGSLIAGLREPSSGLLLRWGTVASAPQYHENHVLTGTLAFNLLMGRKWPPSQAEFDEATAVCRELGLGPLLERMPSGLLQMVGETGWQLSQGERSRVFLARALLQNPDLVILDESFAALDPENLRTALECVLRRARSLLVIAHP